MKVDPSVNSFVRAFLLFDRSGMNQAKGPPLKLVGILLRELFRIRQRNRFPNDLVFYRPAECIGILSILVDKGHPIRNPSYATLSS